jgi:hypothetical protein
MNNNDLFYTNKFKKIPDNKSLGDPEIKKFRQSQEEKNKRLEQQILQEQANKRKTQQDISPRYLDNTAYGSNSKEYIDTKICIDTADRDVFRYPLQNDFKFFLGRTFKNVHKIELVSTSIPNTDTTIKDLPIQLKNNTITWENEEDFDLGLFIDAPINLIVADTVDITITNHFLTIGDTLEVLIFNSKLQSDIEITGFLDGYKEAIVIDSNTIRILWNGGISDTGTVSVNIGLPTYTVTLVPGNYSAYTITKEIAKQCNLVKRRNGTGQFHYFDVSLVIDTNVITLESVITNLLDANPIRTIAGSTIIQVYSVGHGFKTGEIVLMIGALSSSGILGSTLSGNFAITVLDYNNFTYEINVPATVTIAGGGNNVKTGKQAPYKILFDTANTLIQNNLGFNNEDTSGYIGSNNPITTKTIVISDAEITGVNTITITTDVPHLLTAASIIDITNITESNAANRIEVTVASPHLIELPIRVTARYTNSYPSIDGEFIVYPTSPTSFFVYKKFVGVAGNSGKLVYGDDLIQLQGIYTTPILSNVPFFYIDNVVNSTQFDINFSALHINEIDVGAQVNTNHLYINDASHGFNNISSITSYDSEYTIIRPQFDTTIFGRLLHDASTIDGPFESNSVDLIIPNHGLSTSDIIKITNSTSNPSVNGTHAVEIISDDQIRINVVQVIFTPGTSTVEYGDSIIITNSNSLPKIDGNYRIINKKNITNISSGTTETTITIDNDQFGWAIGDNIDIYGTDTTPVLSGAFEILQIVSSTEFKIALTTPLVTSGSTGTVINNSTFVIRTNKTLITPGNSGILGTEQDVILYRVESDDLNGYTLGGMRINEINGVKFNIKSLIDTDNYLIKVIGTYATSTVTSGGNNVYVSTKNKGFYSMISNTVDSSTDTNLARSINLAGEYYMYFTSPGITDKGTIPRIMSSSKAVDEIFAQLLLSESPGLMIYNSFVTAPFIFNPLLPSIENMHFKTVTKGGFPFNYNNVDFAFTLQITEVIDRLDNSLVSSRTGNTVTGKSNLQNIKNVEHNTTNSKSFLPETKKPDFWTIRTTN